MTLKVVLVFIGLLLGGVGNSSRSNSICSSSLVELPLALDLLTDLSVMKSFQRRVLSLGFSESPDRRGINMAARTCKINKALSMVCRPAFRRLS